MTNESKIHVTIELPRDYRVWDLLDLPGRIVDITGVEHISGEKYSVPASEDLSKPGEWVRHTGTECPVHPLDVVEVVDEDGDTEVSAAGEHRLAWKKPHGIITHYRHVCDSEGIPYVYDDGDLPEWAEYVATDSDTDVLAYEHEPWKAKSSNEWDIKSGEVEVLPAKYANTLVPWTESLRRVYRED